MPNQIDALAVPALLRGLTVLADVLQIAEAHAAKQAIAPSSLLTARLFPDMFPLTGQVRSACDTAKRAVARLAGVEPPPFENDSATFEDLYARIRNAREYVASQAATAFADAAARVVEMKMSGATVTLTGVEYLTRFSLPNFYFHLTTAYNILRHNGVALGKRNFLGDLSSAV